MCSTHDDDAFSMNRESKRKAVPKPTSSPSSQPSYQRSSSSSSLPTLSEKPCIHQSKKSSLNKTNNSKSVGQLKVSLFGICKDGEHETDDEGLLTFSKHLFRRPMYQDAAWESYKLMGPRFLTLPQVYWGLFKSSKRYQRKNLPNKLSGDNISDHFLQGGVLFFDAHGELKYCYEEEYGKELNLTIIHQTIEAIRAAQNDTLPDEFLYEAHKEEFVHSSASLLLSRSLRMKAFASESKMSSSSMMSSPDDDDDDDSRVTLLVEEC